jgi:hypothetical protein
MSFNNFNTPFNTIPLQSNILQQVFNTSGNVNLDNHLEHQDPNDEFSDTSNSNRDNHTEFDLFQQDEVEEEESETKEPDFTSFNKDCLFFNHHSSDDSFSPPHSTNDKGHNGKSDKPHTKSTVQPTAYTVPLGLRKPFKIPFSTTKNLNTNSLTTPVITPQAKQNITHRGKASHTTNANSATGAVKTARDILINMTQANQPAPTYQLFESVQNINHTENPNHETAAHDGFCSPYHQTEKQTTDKLTVTDSIFTNENLTKNTTLTINDNTAEVIIPTNPTTTPITTFPAKAGRETHTGIAHPSPFNSSITTTNNKVHNHHNNNLWTSYIRTGNPRDFICQSETQSHKNKLHHSNFIDDTLKPHPESSIELPSDLALLRPLIMSQPKAFTPYLTELGNINLTMSKLIEKKKDSFKSLTLHGKIPRSLRLKCELSTNQEYSTHPTFVRLKEDLHSAVQEFIATGTKIMIDWAETNINLLQQDRCHKILKKALKILGGLTSYYSEVIYTPLWPSVTPKLHATFLFKLYLSNTFIDCTEVINYFSLPPDMVQNIGTKILIESDSSERADSTIETINLSDANLNNENEFTFISETLIAFDQILRITTVDLWHDYNIKAKQISAGLNLSSKMATTATEEATELTASALTRAATLLTHSQEEKTLTNLRINNLEKSLRRQEQKTNEVGNFIKKQNRITPKNYKGSQPQGSLASPTTSTLNKPKGPTNNQHMVDLTTDEDDHTLLNNYKRKQNRNFTSPPPSKRISRDRSGKSVQWKDIEQIQHYNPAQPPLPALRQIVHASSLTQPQNVHMNHSSSLFPPAPLPTPLLAPSQYPSPFGNWNQHYTQTPIPTQNPFLTQNYNNQNNRQRHPFGPTHYKGRGRNKNG